ncbi:NAD binding domain of 6-phosphogluconate dehydrogenase-domain-containing protein [Xylariaceae sp. FL0016]|nr:NAD binding domain of 6-phosphogluconate dehydrogenase-domain-containing protein [Xylariaceae sp. FL0016]
MAPVDENSLPTAIGFIGLGAMGKPMTMNLAERLPPQSRIYVHDVVVGAMDELCASSIGVFSKCKDAKEVAEKSDVVLTMLPEGSHVASVYLDPDSGIVAALKSSPSSAPKLLIDSSTIDTATSLRVKKQLKSSSPQTAFYDAPVSGGVLGAVNATIAFFLGCSPSDSNLQRITTLLETMGSKVIPCGGPSLGLAAKLSNNYLSGIITIATSEAMDMGMRAGIDAKTLASVFAAGTAQNTICDVFNPVPGVCPKAPSSSGYEGGFRIQLMRKDIGLAVDMARRVGARTALGASGLGVYVAASEAEDCKNLDSRVVFRYLGGMEDWQEPNRETSK